MKNGAVVKIANTRNYDGHYHARKIDENTFEIDATWVTSEIGTWEEVPAKETGLVFDGMITAVKRMANGKLRVTAYNHGLEPGDEVQIVNTTAYNSSYPVTKIDNQSFTIDGILWKAGEAVNLKLESRKRRGIVFDGNDDYITIPDDVLKAPSAGEKFEATCSAWIYQSAAGSTEQLIVGEKSASMKLLIHKSGKVAFRVKSGNSLQVEDPNLLPRDQWVHYAGVIRKNNPQSTTLMLYKNGVEAVKKDFQQNVAVPPVLEETQKLQASDKNTINNRFGEFVAISGDTAIVGGYEKKQNNRYILGSAYIFQRKAGQWQQVQKLQPSDNHDNNRFGEFVAISEDTAIVGARADKTGEVSGGAAYIFQRKADQWQQVQKLLASHNQNYQYFGCSVAISRDTAIVGAYADKTGGAAYIFQRKAGTWQQVQKLQAIDKDTDDYFGYSVAISENTAIIGAYLKKDDGRSNVGSAYIFQRKAGTWQQVQKLQAIDKDTNRHLRKLSKLWCD